MNAPQNDEVSTLQKYWKQLVLLLALIGFIVLTLTRVITAGEAAAMSTPILAALVAFSLYETVHEKRRQETARLAAEREHETKRRDEEREQDRRSSARQKRTEAYIGIISHGIYSFTKGGPQSSEADIRAQISLWGSPDFIEAYLEWRSAIAPYTGQGSVKIADHDQPEIQEQLANLVSAARVDVDIDPTKLATIEALASVLFDDYKGKS